MPDVFSEGEGFSYVFFCFAFIQTRWYRGAQKPESPLENMNQSRNVTRAEGAGINICTLSPELAAGHLIFFFSCVRIMFTVFLSPQRVPTAQFCSECGTVRKIHHFKLVRVPLSELPQ